MRYRVALPAIAIAVVLAVAILLFYPSQPSAPLEPVAEMTPVQSSEPPVSLPVPEHKISTSVGKDAIPSLYRPRYVTAEGAVLEDDDIVIGVRINGEAKAYPLEIMLWHEIVHDDIGGRQLAVTYCPLCYTSMVFDTTHDDKKIEFGNSGKLYNNLVMYDKETESYWSQGLGMAITGERTGAALQKVPFDVATWKEWRELYPDTEALSKATGYVRPYGADPYDDYFSSDQIYFPLEHRDDRLHPKEIVVGLEVGGEHKAFRMHDVAGKVINDSVAGREVAIVSLQESMSRAFDRTVDGKVLEFQLNGGRLTDTDTGSEWDFEGRAVAGSLEGRQLERLVLEPSFWFSWSSFHPATKLYAG